MPSREIRDKIEKLVMALSNARRLRPIYGENHKITKEAISSLYKLLKGILTEKEEITIGVVGDEIAFEKEPFYETSKKVKNLINYLKEIKAEKISFAKGIELKELAEFVTILTIKPKDLSETEGI
ncbi:MAG: hypothetical protein KAU58_01190, partial [Candidatus Omnitrophica bacterium]|nr:hypothetical protein [Candidatus Omnitrophota bacterium]